ncbi:hypothetical protein C3B47_04635 [Flavobacterium columnare]|nr:hypothetical protein [Flavobacterium columnare]
MFCNTIETEGLNALNDIKSSKFFFPAFVLDPKTNDIYLTEEEINKIFADEPLQLIFMVN